MKGRTLEVAGGTFVHGVANQPGIWSALWEAGGIAAATQKTERRSTVCRSSNGEPGTTRFIRRC